MSQDQTKTKEKLDYDLPTFFTTGYWMSQNVFKGLYPQVFFITVERLNYYFVIDRKNYKLITK